MPAPVTRLEPDAIGVAQDTVIGMASSAPAATIGLVLAGFAAATAYGSGPILLLTAVPMLIIANAYRRCNMWNANCGASFEWVGRAIDPYLGFLTGWLMVVAYIIGTVAEILLLGPSVLGGVRFHLDERLGVDRHRQRGRRGDAGHRRARYQDHREDPGRHGAGRVPDPDRPGRGRPGGGAQPSPGHAAHHQGLVQSVGYRRQGQRGGRVPDRGVRLRRLGRHPVRQRRGQAPAHQPRPGGHHRRSPARGPLHAGPGRVPGCGVAGEAAGQLGVGAGVCGAGARRRVLGQDDGAVHRACR